MKKVRNPKAEDATAGFVAAGAAALEAEFGKHKGAREFERAEVEAVLRKVPGAPSPLLPGHVCAVLEALGIGWVPE